MHLDIFVVKKLVQPSSAARIKDDEEEETEEVHYERGRGRERRQTLKEEDIKEICFSGSFLLRASYHKS